MSKMEGDIEKINYDNNKNLNHEDIANEEIQLSFIKFTRNDYDRKVESLILFSTLEDCEIEKILHDESKTGSRETETHQLTEQQKILNVSDSLPNEGVKSENCDSAPIENFLYTIVDDATDIFDGKNNLESVINTNETFINLSENHFKLPCAEESVLVENIAGFEVLCNDNNQNCDKGLPIETIITSRAKYGMRLPGDKIISTDHLTNVKHIPVGDNIASRDCCTNVTRVQVITPVTLVSSSENKSSQSFSNEEYDVLAEEYVLKDSNSQQYDVTYEHTTNKIGSCDITKTNIETHLELIKDDVKTEIVVEEAPAVLVIGTDTNGPVLQKEMKTYVVETVAVENTSVEHFAENLSDTNSNDSVIVKEVVEKPPVPVIGTDTKGPVIGLQKEMEICVVETVAVDNTSSFAPNSCDTSKDFDNVTKDSCENCNNGTGIGKRLKLKRQTNLETTSCCAVSSTFSVSSNLPTTSTIDNIVLNLFDNKRIAMLEDRQMQVAEITNNVTTNQPCLLINQKSFAIPSTCSLVSQNCTITSAAQDHMVDVSQKVNELANHSDLDAKIEKSLKILKEQKSSGFDFNTASNEFKENQHSIANSTKFSFNKQAVAEGVFKFSSANNQIPSKASNFQSQDPQDYLKNCGSFLSFCDSTPPVGNEQVPSVSNHVSFVDDVVCISDESMPSVVVDITSPPRKRKCVFEDTKEKKVIVQSAPIEEDRHKKDMDSEELADIVNPRWQTLRYASPEECFAVVHRQWQSQSVPNPHQDLTRRYVRTSWRSNKKIKFDKLMGNQTVANVGCSYLYATDIEDISKNICKLHQEIDNLYRSKRTHNHLLVNPRIEEAMQRRDSYSSRHRKLSEVMNELESVFSFYKNGLNITEHMKDEVVNQDNVRKNMEDYYGRS